MRKGFLILLLLVLLTPAAWPQTSTGSVSGTIRDQSAAVIPNAQVSLTNTSTNVETVTRTNVVGYYYFPGVIPGPYRLSINVTGMAKHNVTFTVQVAQSVAINPVLELASTTAAVEVTAVTPMVSVNEGTIQSTIDSTRIEQLPMNGKQLYSMLLVLPGAEGGDGRRMYGALDVAQEWIIDGVPVQGHRWNNVVASYNPGVGAVQEFAVDSSALGAKQSRPSNVIIATKSGTNQFRGTLYETHRNSGLGVARSRTDYWAKPPHLVRNEFGANGGGPVWIPGMYDGRNKTFWFFNYEGYRMRNPTTRSFNVPTAAMRTGDFSELRDSQGRLQTLYDPWSTDSNTWLRQPFNYGGKTNVINPNRLNPLAKYLFEITPLPTTAANPLVDYNLWIQTPNDWDKAVYIARVDHRFTDKDNVFVRVNRMGFDNITSYTGYGTAWNMPYLNDVAGWKLSRDREIHGSVTWNHTFSPTFFNEVVLAAYYHSGKGSTGRQPVSKDWFGELKVPNPFNLKDWPQFSPGFGNYYITAPGTGIEAQSYYVADNNATKIVGKHQLMFGVHYRRDPLNVLPDTGGMSSFGWGTLATSLYDANTSRNNPQSAPQTGSNLANMAIGVGTYSASLVRNWVYLRSGNTALYLQDNYKVTPRLTLNLGLRWERWPAYREKRNLMVGFDQDKHATILGTDVSSMYALGATLPSIVNTYQGLGWKYVTWDQAGRPQALVNDRNKNFGPRLNFAYRAFDGPKSFVIRGGYSLAYFTIDINSWMNDINGNTPFYGNFNYNPNDATQAPDGISNFGLRSVPTYVNGVNDAGVIDLSRPRGITRGTASATGFAENLPDSRLHSWNLAIEKQILASTVVRASYVGNHTSNLLNFYDYNSATPDYIWYMTTGLPVPTGEYANVARRPYDQQVLGTVREFRATGWGNAQTFTFETERRFSKGYAYQISYAISNALYAGSRSTINTPNLYLPGAIPSDYDSRNRFLNYRRDTGIPKHRVKWNYLIDLPFGKNKPLGRNAGKLLDGIIGGWQMAGIGTLRSNYFSLPTGNWNITGQPVEIYGYKYPIQNCTSGVCVPGYLWWNGYIPANRINSVDANGKPNGYMGVPSDYKPAVTPLIPYGSTALPANAPANTNISSFWDSNNVWIPLKSGSVQRVSFNNNLHPWRNQYMPSIRQWNLDASLFKNINFTERVQMRFSADFFNVFNHPNNNNSVGGDGFINTRDSGQPARVLQLGLRLDF